MIDARSRTGTGRTGRKETGREGEGKNDAKMLLRSVLGVGTKLTSYEHTEIHVCGNKKQCLTDSGERGVRKAGEKEISGDPVGFGRDTAKSGVKLAGVGRNG